MTPTPSCRVSGDTRRDDTDTEFALAIADDISGGVPELQGAGLELQGFGAPTDGDVSMLVLNFILEGDFVSIGITIESGSSNRSPFNIDRWNRARKDPSASDIVVGSFDEAWLIACATGQRLEVSSVQISYGA